MYKVKLFLEKFPVIKRYIKCIYIFVRFILNRKNYKYRSNYVLESCLPDSKGECFFGYYDKSPINKSGRYCILNETKISKTTELPTSEISINVVLYDNIKNVILNNFESKAYNWQQGTKLMWIDDSNFIFNDFDSVNKRYISKIVNVEKNCIVKILEYPIYDVHDNFALTLNFNRLMLLRPDYGYRNMLTDINFEINNNDGIYILNLKDNKYSLLVSIDEVIKLHFRENMCNAKHWFNHIMISPDGDKCMFLHRWFFGLEKFDALIVCNIDGTGLRCLVDDDMVSHCFWKDDNTIISYMRTKSNSDNYYEINLITNNISVLGNNVISNLGDGHPSVYGNKMIFDTYPDKSRMKKLYIYDLETNELEELGEFFEPLNYMNECRCDLHPKFSDDGKLIFIDSVHTGKRNLYKIVL